MNQPTKPSRTGTTGSPKGTASDLRNPAENSRRSGSEHPSCRRGAESQSFDKFVADRIEDVPPDANPNLVVLNDWRAPNLPLSHDWVLVLER
jgi:hypothetical protein